MRLFRSPYFLAFLLFAVAVVFGLANYQDYGMAWDERAQHDIGAINYEYVFNDNRAALDNFVNRDYGPAFELVLIAIEKMLHIDSLRDVYLMRHLACHFFFLIGCLFAYMLVLRMYKNSLLAALGFLIMYLIPRFYAHSFFNSKDIVFLASFMISFWAIYMAFEKKKAGWFILAGILCGYTTGIRVLGVIMPAVVGLVLFLNALANMRSDKKSFIRSLSMLAVFGLTTAVSIVAFWPLLWTSPFNNFIESYGRMAHFRWDNWMLLSGEMVRSTELPLKYFPVWFCITVPILWIFLGVTGIVWFLVDLFRKPMDYLKDLGKSIHIVYLMVFALPIAMVIIMDAVLYDEWRHLFFVFSGFLMFVVFAIYKLQATRWKMSIIGLSALQLAVLVFFMIKNHPYQHVYFNELVSRQPEQIRHNYEMDYWGVSAKQALEFILEHDSSSSIRVGASEGQYPVPNNIGFLTEDQQRRLVNVGETDSFDYFVTFFRWHPEDYPGHVPLHEIKVLNSTIARISKLQNK